MSTALFLNTKKRLSDEQLFAINNCFEKNRTYEINLRSVGKLINVDGENYYFDSMWIPFLKPLSEFEARNVDKYSELISIFEAIKEIIGYLLNENQSIKLFLASVEDKEILIKGQIRLKISDIDEFKSFEWGTIYEIGK